MFGKNVERVSGAALLVMLTACGSGGGESSNAGSNVDAVGSPAQALPAGQITGRVADGYIQGATVCVDLNENDACDPDEPSAVTGAGGLYQLDVPQGAEGKPIVADIPAEAIDEDTGEMVGKALVFVAPGSRPLFLSPITTMIHHELKANPDLAIDDAENNVKSILGIDDTGISLFTDYVEGGRNPGQGADSRDRAETFRYVHDAARVVAGMMQDIETQVANSAVAQGIDIGGDLDNRRAVRDIVRSEVRALLPDIAREVAKLVTAGDPATSDSPGEAATGAFNPRELALALRPVDVSANLGQRIAAIRDRVGFEKADIRQLLTDGIYWAELDCTDVWSEEYRTHPVGQLLNVVAVEHEIDIAGDTSHVEGDAEGVACEAFYGLVKLTESGDELLFESHIFDPLSGSWLPEEDDDVYPQDYSLVDGTWVQGVSLEPTGKVRFTDAGTAVIATAGGTMTLKASSHALDDMSMKKNFLDDEVEIEHTVIGESGITFLPGAQIHRVSVREESSPYLLFNDVRLDESGADLCMAFNGNCNVVSVISNGQFFELTTLDDILQSVRSGVTLAASPAGLGPQWAVTLEAIPGIDGTTLPEGVVTWAWDATDTAAWPDSGLEAVVDGFAVDGFTVDGLVVDGLTVDGAVIEEAMVDGAGTDAADHSAAVSTPPLLTSRWRLVTKQGVSMIEVDLPLALRHDQGMEYQGIEYEEDTVHAQALLLIEQDGFVRMGVRTSAVFNEKVIGYNEAAFQSVKQLIETVLMNKL